MTFNPRPLSRSQKPDTVARKPEFQQPAKSLMPVRWVPNWPVNARGSFNFVYIPALMRKPTGGRGRIGYANPTGHGEKIGRSGRKASPGGRPSWRCWARFSAGWPRREMSPNLKHVYHMI